MSKLKKISYQPFTGFEDERVQHFDSLNKHITSAQEESKANLKSRAQVISRTMQGNVRLVHDDRPTAAKATNLARSSLCVTPETNTGVKVHV